MAVGGGLLSASPLSESLDPADVGGLRSFGPIDARPDIGLGGTDELQSLINSMHRYDDH